MKRRAKKVLRTMVLMVAMMCLACPAAFATDPSTSVDIHINGLGTTPVATYSTTQLTNNFTQHDHIYSSYYCQDEEYKDYRAVGPLLADVLTTAGVTYDSNDTINFYDGTWNTGDLTISTIMAGVYYADPNGSPTAVEPIIAVQYCSPANGTLSNAGTLRNFHGQPSGIPDDDTMSEWCKYMDDINIIQ